MQLAFILRDLIRVSCGVGGWRAVPEEGPPQDTRELISKGAIADAHDLSECCCGPRDSSEKIHWNKPLQIQSSFKLTEILIQNRTIQ